MILKRLLFLALLLLFFASNVFAQTSSAEDLPVSQPVLILFILFILSVLPFIFLMTTSFVKIAVVLSLIRSALGVQQIPPNQVITGLALILTIYIMIPVGQEVYDKSYDVIHVADTNQPLVSTASLNTVKQAVDAGKEPVREFLLKHVHDQERKLFYGLGKKLKINQSLEEPLTDKDFIVLVPAFVISELSDAFQIGFIIFLPFLVIDIVISNILLSMGMFQVSPITISLPFKLLLFVLVDGWYLIVKSLVTGYVT